MDPIKVLVVDDEVLIAEDLKDILRSFGLNQVELAHSKSEALVKLASFEPDVALLDIRMEKEFDGLELGEIINARYKIPFIYITAHSDIAMIREIVKTKPAGYITKPFKKSDLFASLNLVAKKDSEPGKSQLMIKDGYKTVLINYSEIEYIESEGNYLNIYYGNRKVVSRQSLDSILDDLDKEIFFKVHRSYIINLRKIIRYSKKDVEIGSLSIPISRNLIADFEATVRALK
jgi:DNA-binding LytR/AlgR family response regulator